MTRTPLLEGGGSLSFSLLVLRQWPFRWYGLLVGLLALLAVAPLAADTPASDETIRDIKANLQVAQASYWFGIEERGNVEAFDKGLDHLARARRLMEALQGGDADHPALYALQRQFQALSTDLEEQREIAHDTLFGVFPLSRFLTGSLFMDASAAGTFELFDDATVMAATSAADRLVQALESGYRGTPQFKVLFNSIPRDTALENEVLYVFNQHPRFFVQSRSDVVGALCAGAAMPSEAEKWLQQLDKAGQLPDPMRAVLFERFDTQRLLIVTVRQLPATEGDSFVLLHGELFQPGRQEPVFTADTMGFSRDRTGSRRSLLWLHALLLAAGFVGFAALVRYWSGAPLTLGKVWQALGVVTLAFVMARFVLPWMAIPVLLPFRPQPETLAVQSFWWPVAAVWAVTLLPLAAYRALSGRIAALLAAGHLDDRLSAIAIPIAMGSAAYLGTLLLMYDEGIRLITILTVAAALALNGFLCGRALDRHDALSAGYAGIPVVALGVGGLALFTNDMRFTALGLGLALVLPALTLALISRRKAADVPAATGLDQVGLSDAPIGAGEGVSLTLAELEERLKRRPYLCLGEFREAERALRSVAEGRTVWLQLSGESGTGKTATLEALVSRLREGCPNNAPALVLRSSCPPADQAGAPVPYAPIHQAVADKTDLHFSSPPAGSGAEDGIDLVANMLAAPLLSLADMFAVDEGGSEAGSAVDLHARFAEELGRLSRNRTVLLCLDDVQWLDPSSWELLRYFFSHTPPGGRRRIAVLLAGREGADAPGALPGGRSGEGLTQVDLSPLNLAEQEHLLTECFGASASLCDWVIGRYLQADAGIPQRLVDTMTVLHRQGCLECTDDGFRLTAEEPQIPNDARAEVDQALAAHADQRLLLLAAAALGKEFEVSLVSEAVGWDVQTTLMRLDLFERATGLLRDKVEDDDIYHFRSYRVLEGFRQALGISFAGPANREVNQPVRHAHGAIADALASRLDAQSGRQPEDLYRLARHLYAAGKRRAVAAVAANLAAVRAAKSAFDFPVARAYLEQATECANAAGGRFTELEREGLLLDAEEAHVHQDPDASERVATKLLNHLEPHPDASGVLGIAAARACFDTAAGFPYGTDKRALWLGRCAEVAAKLYDDHKESPLLAAEALQFLALAKKDSDRPDERIETYRRAMGLLTTGADSKANMLWCRIADSLANDLTWQRGNDAEMNQRSWDEAAGLFERCVEIREQAAFPDLPGLARSHGGWGRLLLFTLSEPAQAKDHFQEDLELSKTLLDGKGIAKMHCLIGQCEQKLGKNGPAAASYRRSLAGEGDAMDVATAFLGLMKIAVSEGDVEALREHAAGIPKRTALKSMPAHPRSEIRKLLLEQNLVPRNELQVLLDDLA